MEDRLKKIMARVLDINISDIDENTSPDTISNWDSLHQLDLILAIEEEFNVSLSMDQIAKLLNYKIIKSTLTELINSDAAGTPEA